MSARDELYKCVFDAFDALDDPAETRNAPAIITDDLISAGYSKPRTITTAEELDTLPDESVVLSDFGVIHQKCFDFASDDTFWMGIGADEEYTAGKIALPATVLYIQKES